MDLGKPHEKSIQLKIDEVFRAYVGTTVGRLQYLKPNWTISASQSDMIEIRSVDDPAVVEREVRYALYREKIYAESASMRERMQTRIFG